MDTKWAVITGANGGIGRALVNTFQKEGVSVIAIDMSFTHANKVSETLVQLNTDIAQIVTDTHSAEVLHQDIKYFTGQNPVYALVNNAAIQLLHSTKDMTRETWQQTLNVNLSAPFFLTQMLYDDLTATKGAVVNISSIHAQATKKRFCAYATSKAALSGMTKSMAVDVGSDFTISAIEPAAVATEMLESGFSDNPEAFQRLKAFHPVGRIASPQEIAELALFLCSEKAAFLHGACISATGGILGCLSDPG